MGDVCEIECECLLGWYEVDFIMRILYLYKYLKFM